MQVLCQFDVQGDRFVVELDSFLSHADASADAKRYARELVAQVRAKSAEYDDLIRKTSEHWDLARISIVDRNIVRVGICELCEHHDVPSPVAINEAVDIAKEFGAAESGAFVNGVLDAVRTAGQPAST